MEFFDALAELVRAGGYAGIMIAVCLEYACFPISSEILLPLIGCCAAKEGMDLKMVILFSTIGGITGSFFCYGIGNFGGRILERGIFSQGTGKAKELFLKYGTLSVFFCRLFPLARTYISFPAGMSHMNKKLFLVYTGAGAAIWNTALLSAGYYAQTLNVLEFFKSQNGIIIFFIFIFLLSFLLFKYIFLTKKKRL